MHVSIIIINYNTIQFLINAIDSIFVKTKDIEYEIIVVDNNSTITPNNILTEKYSNKITYLGLSENIGFGRANNEAAKIAKGKYLFFLNPDTILLNNSVKILSDYLDDNPTVGCCGGNLVDKDGMPVQSFYRYLCPSLFDELNELLFGLFAKLFFGKNINYNYSNKPINVGKGYITGADLMIRKDLFNNLKGFDPIFFMYSEEAELEYRIKKAGYEIINIPSARIIHLESKSFLNNFDKMKKLYDSRIIFLQKTHNPISIIIINFLFFLKIKQHIFVFILLRKKERITLWSHWDIIRKQSYFKHRGKL